MTSPDLSPYFDLTLYDKDPQDLVDAFVLDLRTKLADWRPNEGDEEMLAAESLALIVAELIFAVNRLPNTMAEGIFRLYGVDRFLGSAPTTTLAFQMSDQLGHDLPPGTRARLILGGGLDPVTFTTVTGLTVPAGSNMGAVQAVGDRMTDEANGYGSGTTLELLDAVVYVERVSLAATITDGRPAEDDAEWFNRATSRVSRLTESLVLPRHFTAAALERTEVARAFTIDNYNPATPGTPPGQAAGYVTVAVYGYNGALTQPQMDAIDTDFESRTEANLSTSIVAPTVTAVPVTATIQAAPGYAPADVKAAVDLALRRFLDPQTWPWSGTVRRNDLIALIEGVPGVDYLQAGHPTAPSADVALPGVANLATAGTLTLTVNAAP